MPWVYNPLCEAYNLFKVRNEERTNKKMRSEPWEEMQEWTWASKEPVASAAENH